jgi:hypothetical protein
VKRKCACPQQCGCRLFKEETKMRNKVYFMAIAAVLILGMGLDGSII